MPATDAPPTLIVAFNRPEHFRRVLMATLEAKPARLYVAVDGPRQSVADDVALTEQVQAIADIASDDCDAMFRFRDRNLGCRNGMIDAIDWFMANEPEGIILEDDCLPGHDFFRFAGEMLHRYRDDPQVMSISGHGVLRGLHRPRNSYTFVRTPMVWGWATWRRAWMRLDRDGNQWAEVRDGDWLSRQGGKFRDFERHWRRAFENAELIDSWAYTWTFSSWVNDGLCVIPYRNLVANTGFGADATHTLGIGATWYGLVEGIAFPLDHPAVHSLDSEAELRIQRCSFGVMLPSWYWRRLRGEIRRLGALALGRSRLGAAWLERRRLAARANARR